MNDFLIALQFLVPLTVRGRCKIVKESDLAKSMAWFSAAGLFIGLILTGLYSLLILFFPQIVVCALILLSMILVSGAMHLDGLADTVDGIAGGKDKNNILKIMHDSNIGAVGAVVVFACLLIKFSCLYSFSPGTARLALIGSSVLSRWAFVFSAAKWQPAPDNDGLGRKFIDFVGNKELFFASIVAAAGMLFIFKLKAIIIISVIILFIAIFNNFIKNKIGGLTGDTIGAAGELTETLTLLVISTIL